MIISKTPFRVSLFGGGTDYADWVREHGGDVLGFAIDKYCWLTLRRLPPFFPHRHRIVHSAIELVQTIDEIQHPAAREILRRYYTGTGGLELHHDGDLPARSGLGSSSSFCVGLINALAALRGQLLDRRYLASEAIRVEQKILAENVGSQDQVWAAYGGFNRIRFHVDGDFTVMPIISAEIRRAEMMRSLLLFYTGTSRVASEIAGKQIAGFAGHTAQLHAIAALVPEALDVLYSASTPIRRLGALLDQGWRMKRELADGVSTPQIDEIYASAKSAGALGGKLLGAGGGGFLLLYVPPEAQEDVRDRLRPLVEVRFDIARAGSVISIYEPNGLS